MPAARAYAAVAADAEDAGHGSGSAAAPRSRASSLLRAVQHWVPLARWLPGYAWRAHLAGDLLAGLTVTAVAAPEAVAYAGIAGLPAAQGLYTGFAAPLAYALAGASPQLVRAPRARRARAARTRAQSLSLLGCCIRLPVYYLYDCLIV